MGTPQFQFRYRFHSGALLHKRCIARSTILHLFHCSQWSRLTSSAAVSVRKDFKTCVWISWPAWTMRVFPVSRSTVRLSRASAKSFPLGGHEGPWIWLRAINSLTAYYKSRKLLTRVRESIWVRPSEITIHKSIIILTAPTISIAASVEVRIGKLCEGHEDT